MSVPFLGTILINSLTIGSGSFNTKSGILDVKSGTISYSGGSQSITVQNLIMNPMENGISISGTGCLYGFCPSINNTIPYTVLSRNTYVSTIMNTLKNTGTIRYTQAHRAFRDKNRKVYLYHLNQFHG